MLTLFTLPNPTDTIASTSAYSVPWFTELFLIGVVIIGILLAGMGVSKIMSVIMSSAKKVIGGRRGRGRGRRR